MNVQDSLRLIAGIMILISLLLATYVSNQWLWFTAFIGINLLQSGLSKWCPMMSILRKLGLKE